jgi:hypothetical protein
VTSVLLLSYRWPVAVVAGCLGLPVTHQSTALHRAGGAGLHVWDAVPVRSATLHGFGENALFDPPSAVRVPHLTPEPDSRRLLPAAEACHIRP